MSKNKTQVCDICGDINAKCLSLKVSYTDNADVEQDYKLTDYVCSEKCLHEKIKEIYNVYGCSVTVKYPHAYIDKNMLYEENKEKIKGTNKYNIGDKFIIDSPRCPYGKYEILKVKKDCVSDIYHLVSNGNVVVMTKRDLDMLKIIK